MTYSDRGFGTAFSVLLCILFAACASSAEDAAAADRSSGGFTLNATDILWEQTGGPEGGDFRQIEIHPFDPSLLVSGNSGGIYVSVNGGESWEKTAGMAHLSDIEYSLDGRIVYAAASGTNVYRSEDEGRSWEMISPGDSLAHVNQIVVSPDDPDTVYLSSSFPGRIYKSSDRGDSWKELARFPEEHISSFGVTETGRIILGAGGSLEGQSGRFLVSVNSGRSWESPDIGQAEISFLSSVLVNPDNPGIVYAGFGDPYNRSIEGRAEDFLFRSDDGGESWRPVPHNFHDAMINILSSSGSGGKTIYTGCGATLYKTADGGESWRRLLGGDPFEQAAMDLSPMDFVDMEVHPEDPELLYLPLAGAGIARSRDGGGSWEHINKGLIGMSVGHLLVSPHDAGTVYAAGLPIGVPGTFKSTNYGESWIKLDGGGIYHPFTDELYMHPGDPDRLFEIGDVGILYESVDAGKSWKPLFDPQYGMNSPVSPKSAFQFSSVYALGVAEDDPDLLYAVKNGFGVFKSRDGGENWEYQVFSPDYSYSIVPDPDNPEILYSGYRKKVFEDEVSLYRSSSDSEEWDSLMTLPGRDAVRWVEIDPSHPERIYAGVTGDKGEVYISRDRGRSWKVLNDQLNFTTVWGHSQLQISPDDPDTVYAGTWGGGSYRTRNGGGSWDKLDEEHTFSPTSIQVSPDNPEILYACDRTAPLIHRSDDGGEHWRVYYDFRDDFGASHFMSSALAIVPGDPERIIAASFRLPMAMAGALVLVGPEGMERDLSEGLPRSVIEIEIDDRNRDLIYVAAHVHGVYKSVNSGRSWTRLDGGGSGLPVTGVYDIDIHPGDSDLLFASALSGELPPYMIRGEGIEEHLKKDGRVQNIEASAQSGVYLSRDGGKSWKLSLSTISEAKGIEISKDNPYMIFAADMEGGVWVSTDGGDNWRQENEGLGSRSMTSVKYSDRKIYAGTQGSGVYAGTVDRNGSIRWIASKSNKPAAEVGNLQIEVDPENPARIFASAYPGGMFRSDDGGKNWNDKNFLTPSIRVEDPSTQGYYSFDLNPDNPGNVWMGVYGKGMFVSRDGMDFNMNANGKDGIMRGKHITRVLINPADSSEVWAAAEEGVFVTRDGGVNWIEENSGLHSIDVYTLCISGDGTLYAGTRGYGVYRYDRRARRWNQTRSIGNFGVFWSSWDRPLYQYSAMLIDPDNTDNWYLASFPTGLYKSTDAGISWKESNVGFIDEGADGIFSLTFHPDDRSVIFAGTYNGVSVTRDGGEHWERLADGMASEQWPFSIAIDPENPQIMYAATKNGQDRGFFERHEGPDIFAGKVYKTTDGGKNWKEIMNGLTDDNEYYTILIHPKNSRILFVNSQHDGVFMSLDGGGHWQSVNRGLENTRSGNANNVSHSLVLSADGRYLYFGTMGAGVWKAELY